MLTLEGTYENGKIELAEKPKEIEKARVLVTFLESKEINLSDYEIDEAQAAELRRKFAAFEDWNAPEMDIYDDYDNAKRALENQT